MRIHPDFLQSTVFLCVDVRKEDERVAREAKATGFVVEIPNAQNPNANWNYIVTARHCIEERTADETIFIRINTVVVSSSIPPIVDIPTRRNDWFVHPSADVAAVMLANEPRDSLSFKSIKLHWFVDANCKFRPSGPQYDETVTRSGSLGIEIGVGDELFFTGLFVQSAGKQGNLPIARFGNISRMPYGDPMDMRSEFRGHFQIHAYLAECHSWGGHSGSPVFWHWEYARGRPAMISPTEYHNFLTTRSYIRAFMGLVSGHFDIPVGAQQADRADDHIITTRSPWPNERTLIHPASRALSFLRRSSA